MTSQNATGATVLHNLKSAAGSFERPKKRARLTRHCEESSTTRSAAARSALLAEQGDYKNCCEAMTIENKCISVLAAEANELRKILANREEANVVSKATSKVAEGIVLPLPICMWLDSRQSSPTLRLCNHFCSKLLLTLRRTLTRRGRTYKTNTHV